MIEIWAVTESNACVCGCECGGYESSDGTSVIELFDNEQTARQFADMRGEYHRNNYVEKLSVHSALKTVPDWKKS